MSKPCKFSSFNLLYHCFLRSKFFFCLLISDCSLLLLPLIFLNHDIAATSSLLLSSFLSVQHSDPYMYVNTGSTSAQYSIVLVWSDILFVLRILSSFPKAAHARPIPLHISVHLPSSFSVPPRYTNFVTCSSTSPANFYLYILVLFFNNYCHCLRLSCRPIYSQPHSSAASVYSIS